MRRAAPRHRRSRRLALGWRLLALASLVILAIALYLWWQGGMWSNGALPTHGMIPTVGAAAAVLVLVGLKAIVDRYR